MFRSFLFYFQATLKKKSLFLSLLSFKKIHARTVLKFDLDEKKKTRNKFESLFIHIHAKKNFVLFNMFRTFKEAQRTKKNRRERREEKEIRDTRLTISYSNEILNFTSTYVSVHCLKLFML